MKKIVLLLACLISWSFAFAQNKSYTFVFLNNKPDKEVLSKEKSDSIMQGHMDNIGRLAKEGKLLAAGPFEGGGGIFVLNTTSTKEANEWLATDPGIKAKRWNLELFSFTPRIGSICPVGDSYQMTSYQFVRFTLQSGITPLSSKQHGEFIQKLKEEGLVIAEGSLDSKDSILVLKADVTKEKIETDPPVQFGLYRAEMKKLYIAQGSFCEK